MRYADRIDTMAWPAEPVNLRRIKKVSGSSGGTVNNKRTLRSIHVACHGVRRTQIHASPRWG